MANSNANIHLDSEQSAYPDLDSWRPIPISSRLNYPTTTTNSSASNINCNSKAIPSIQESSTSIKRMVIFDWDDTLFPTTQFVYNQDSMSIEDLHNWGQRVHQLLKKYIEAFGSNNIYIINGIHGWIQDSLKRASQRFKLLNNQKSPKKVKLVDPFSVIDGLLIFHEIKTISARSLFVDQYPNNPKKWKEYTFIHYALDHFHDDNKGIILSIGDSDHEWIASKDCQQFLTNLDKNAFKFDLQRIKLKSEPTLAELMEEWETLIFVVDHWKLKNKSLDQNDLYSVGHTLRSKLNKTSLLN